VTGVTDEGSVPRRGAPGPEPSPAITPIPGTLRAAIGLLFAEALLVVVLLVYDYLTATVVVWRDALIVTGFAVLIAFVLALLGWALSQRRSWARGPAVVLELMLLPIGWFMVSGGLVWLGVPVFLLGLLGAGLLVTPATRHALGVE
jgi:hypothetical protein